MCISKGCPNESLYGYYNDVIPFVCLEHKTSGMVLKDHYYCCSCTNRAEYGHLIAKYCTSHKEEGMIKFELTTTLPVGGKRRCSFANCSITAYWNYWDEPVGRLCGAHKKRHMFNFDRLYCNSSSGCMKIPSYYNKKSNYVYCEDHKNASTVPICLINCSIAGCENIAEYKTGHHKMPVFCEIHTHSDTHKLDLVKCSVDGCKNIALFKKEGSGHGATMCVEHKQDNMRQADKQFLCKTTDCTKDAEYGPVGKVACKCFDHKTDDMVYSRSKCLVKECTKKALFNYKNESKPIYCGKHKLGNMTARYSLK